MPSAKNFDGKVAGKSFCLTGSLSIPRKQLMTIIFDSGARVAHDLRRSTDYLITGVNPGPKLSQARHLGIAVITEDEALGLLVPEKTAAA